LSLNHFNSENFLVVALWYQVSIKTTPYDHQKKAFAFACDKFGVFDERLKSRGTALLMEMGTGKTIVSIAVAGCMYQYG